MERRRDGANRSRRCFCAGLAALAGRDHGAIGLLLGAGVAGCAAPATRSGSVVEVAADVYLVRGADGEPGGGNLGRVGNAGFIVGSSGVVVVDSGTSHAQGLALIATVARVTARPIRRLVLTHARQEFVFGATAFRERGIPVTMHRRASRLMHARCDRCLHNLQRLLGDAAMRGTAIVDPDELIDGDLAIDDVGREVRLLSFAHASGPGDVAVLDATTGTLFAGGLLDVHRVPDVMDADLAGWRSALTALASGTPGPAGGAVRAVPGHGEASTAATAIDDVLGYLDALEACVRSLLDSGVPLSAVPRSADLPRYASWDLYDTLHRRNAAVLYIRLEAEQLNPG